MTPLLTARPDSFKKSDVIPFDGQYWYFRPPQSGPGPDAHMAQGEPTKVRIRSTDSYPIVMEAHQRLGQPIEANCCRALQLNLVNADAVPGKITLEVQLRETNGNAAMTMLLGEKGARIEHGVSDAAAPRSGRRDSGVSDSASSEGHEVRRDYGEDEAGGFALAGCAAGGDPELCVSAIGTPEPSRLKRISR